MASSSGAGNSSEITYPYGIMKIDWIQVLARVARIALACAVLAPGTGFAQTSQQQLEMFRNLTPEQQQAVLEQFGGQQGSVVPPSATPNQVRQPAANGEGQRDQRRRVGSEDEEPLIPVLRPDDTVVVELSLPPEGGQVVPGPQPQSTDRQTARNEPSSAELSASQRRQRLLSLLDLDGRGRLEDLVTLVLSRNPYRLDRDAQLTLPGFAPIPLGGLTEQQATQRLSVEPVLLPLEVRLSRLPLAKTGIAALKRFGYELFNNPPSTFSPINDVPVPADYVLGPGDQLNVQLFGSQNRNYPLRVSREGTVSFPELGPVRVGGMTFDAARRAIESRVARQMIGVQASVSIGDTRSIRVYVMGEARQPGSYTVSGLATMSTALFASGGVKPIGSLRDIQLKRQGVVVRRFDLYDMLIQGDTSDDAKLQPGDVIFIPPVGPTVTVDGEVKRPAIYELRDEAAVADVVRIAGGFTPEADINRASLTRIGADSRRVVLNVNLRTTDGGQALRNGDVLRVSPLRPQIDAGVMLEGFVYRPGPVAWREGLRLTDVLGSVEELKPSADQRYVLVRRESGPDRRISVFSADLVQAWAAPDTAANVVLEPRDRITVFDLAPGRERIIEPLMEELRLQSELARPTQLVSIGGSVKVPGQYPLEPGMRVSDLLRAGGSLGVAAFGGEAELTRYVVGSTGIRETQLISVNLAALRSGDLAANLELQPFDYLLIKETPEWGEQESVRVRGEVKFPGTYPIRQGETLRQVLERAGGLNSQAFPEGSIFVRRYLRELEQQQLDRLSARLRSDIAALALQASNAGQANANEAMMMGQSLLSQLQTAQATGRFVIDLPGLLVAGVGSEKDVVLRGGDELIVPKRRQEVTVIGEIQNQASHLYQSKLSRSDYIAKSGGTNKKADKDRIYVVRADGSVATEKGIKAGDTIVVPLDTERMPRLPFWQAVTQILYNIAVSVAALDSF